MKSSEFPSEEEGAFKCDDIEACVLSQDDLVKRLKTDPERGLSQKEAEERLRLLGPNVIPKIKPGLFRTYIAPLINWLIIIYLIVSMILILFAIFVLPEVWNQVIPWLSVISINAALAIVQQVRAQAKLEALTRLSAPKSKVIRNGELMEIPSEQIVLGDIIELRQGDRVPADARILVASGVRVNESALTGESVEVEKSESDVPLEGASAISGRKNTLFQGTYVVNGSARALVVKTGAETQFGRISKSLKEHTTNEILLLQKVNRIARYLGLGVLIYLGISLMYKVIFLYSSGSLFADGAMNTHMLAKAVVESFETAMSIMPINIPLLTTIVLLTGILAMAKHRVIIRNLNAVESLGRVSVICSDKTGTITKNEMTAKWICLQAPSLEDQLYGVTGVGFQPEGRIAKVDLKGELDEILKKEPETLGGNEMEVQSETPLEYLLLSSMLENDSVIIQEKVRTEDKKKEQKVYKILGDSTDAALLVLFGKSKLNREIYRARFKKVQVFPFDSNVKRITTVFQDTEKSGYTVFTRGATESLLPMCNFASNGKTVTEVEILDEEKKRHINEEVSQFSSSGYRVISFAFRHFDASPLENNAKRENFENDLVYLGFVAIIDPPREGVHEAVIEAKDAGIKPTMMTGDSAETAMSIARQVGIADEGELTVKGYEIGTLSDEELLRTSVYARVSPEDKMKIVDRYRRQNRAVAMTGDGINDAPAVSMADVGIAMGITGTDVTKEAADMIIADDSFNSIIVGVREGRGIFQKIRAVIFFYIAVNLAEALVYFGSSLIPWFYLLNQWQKIYIYMTVHSLPPFALIIDRLSKDVMKDKPRDTEGINRQQKIALLFFPIALAIVLYIVYFGTLNGIIPVFEENMMGYLPNLSPNNPYGSASWAQAKARTMLLTVALISECTLIISLRRTNKHILRTLKEDNYWIAWLFILLVPTAHLLLMYIPATQTVLEQSAGINLEVIQLKWIDWSIAFILGLIPIAWLELYKTWMRKRGLLF